MAKLINGVMRGRPKRTPEQVDEDFLARFVKRDSGCWEWVGCLEKHGYGVMQIEEKQWRMHIYSWTRVHGPVPDGLLVLHKCNNKCCVNPDHLYLGDDAANGRDKAVAGVHKGVKNAKAKLTEADVLKIREMYATGLYSQWDLAKMYDVWQTRISDIVRRKHWSHI